MKAKKPLLLIVLTLVLLAVALILPAAAFGKPAATPANQPVAWVNAYTNSNHLGFEFEFPYRVTLSADVKLLGSGELVGDVVNRLYLRGVGVETYVMHPVKSDWTVFTEHVAQFLVELEDGSHVVILLTDNGEPPTGDRLESFDPDTGTYGPGGAEAAGNVQIHLSKGYVPLTP
jgi:hypothetical protein